MSDSSTLVSLEQPADCKDCLIIRLQYPGPEALITVELAHTMQEIIFDIEDNHPNKPVIITSNGNNFCQGLDLGHYWTGSQPNTHEFHKFEKLLNSLERLNNLTIAALDGQCVGAGLDLALACDLRAAGTSAIVASNEVALGMVPEMAVWRLPKYVGLGRARELLFTGRQLNADQAQTLGLIDCCDTSARKAADTLIERVPWQNTKALMATRRLLNEAYAAAYQEAIGHYLACQAMCLDQL